MAVTYLPVGIEEVVLATSLPDGAKVGVLLVLCRFQCVLNNTVEPLLKDTPEIRTPLY